MKDDLNAWIRPANPPSQRTLQRRYRRRMLTSIVVIGAFLFGLAYGRFSATPVRLVCHAPDGAKAFVCQGETH